MNYNNTDKDPADLDWEYQDDFYNEGNLDKKEIPSLDKFMKEMEEPETPLIFHEEDAESVRLKQTIQDVRNIKAQYTSGKNVPEISKMLNLESEYVTLIMLTLQGYAEDDDIAIAHMVMLG